MSDNDARDFHHDWNQPLAQSDVTTRVRAYLPSLTGASNAVARHVLDDPATVVSSSIADVAAVSGTSQASVTRFCQAIGLSGFPALRLQLAAELGRSPSATWSRDLGSDIGVQDTPSRVAALVASADIRALQATASTLDEGTIQAAADSMASAPRVLAYGAGGSALVAQEAQFRLSRIGRPIWCFPDVHQTKMFAALLTRESVFLGVSRSGRTHEVVDAMRTARDVGATTIALTSFPRSPLAQMADIVLTTAIQDTSVRHGSLAARHAQLLVLDVVYCVVAQLTYEQSTEALSVTTSALVSHRSTPRSAARPPATTVANDAPKPA